MMIALPNPDRSFTCTLFWPKSGPGGFDELETEDEILAHFTAVYPDAVPLMPTLVEDYQFNPVGLLATIHADPWQVDGTGTSPTNPRGIKIGGSFPQDGSQRNPCNCRMDGLMFLDDAASASEVARQYRRLMR